MGAKFNNYFKVVITFHEIVMDAVGESNNIVGETKSG